MNIEPEDARRFIDKISPHLGHDFTYTPQYPRSRKDICAVRHSSEDGIGYGFDTIYLLWIDKTGLMRFLKLSSSDDSRDYTHIAGILENHDEIVVKINNGVRGVAWSAVFRKNKTELDLA